MQFHFRKQKKIWTIPKVKHSQKLDKNAFKISVISGPRMANLSTLTNTSIGSVRNMAKER
jgi:hypothetical protein